jgi:hypothetical protein
MVFDERGVREVCTVFLATSYLNSGVLLAFPGSVVSMVRCEFE